MHTIADFRTTMSDKENPDIPSPRPIGEVITGAVLDGNGSLTRQVYGILRNLVVELTLVPNQFLSEKDVAACLGISRTPVREAFILLAEDGIVRIVPKSGTYVSAIDINRACDGYFIRAAIESSCAAIAAEKRTVEDVRSLREILDAQKRAFTDNDFMTYYLCDNRLHESILDIAGYSSAKRVIETVKFEVDRIRHLKMRELMRPVEEALADHVSIVNAVGHGNADLAREIMYRHLSRIRESMETLIINERLWDMFHAINKTGYGKRRNKPSRSE